MTTSRPRSRSGIAQGGSGPTMHKYPQSQHKDMTRPE